MSAAHKTTRRPLAGSPQSPGDGTARELSPRLARGSVAGNSQPSLFDEPAPNGPADLGWNKQQSITRGPQLFPIPPATPPRACRSCGASVFWIITTRGRRMPANADGTSHLSNCPNAAEHRRPR